MSYKSKFTERYKIGKESEIKVLEIIQNYFKTDIKASINQLERFDFFDDNNKFELKTRTNNLNTYPTTIIGFDKLKSDIILLFQFTDQLAYIKYDAEQFKNYEVKKFTKYKIPKDHIYIPVKDLTIIEIQN